MRDAWGAAQPPICLVCALAADLCDGACLRRDPLLHVQLLHQPPTRLPRSARYSHLLPHTTCRLPTGNVAPTPPPTPPRLPREWPLAASASRRARQLAGVSELLWSWCGLTWVAAAGVGSPGRRLEAGLPHLALRKGTLTLWDPGQLRSSRERPVAAKGWRWPLPDRGSCHVVEDSLQCAGEAARQVRHRRDCSARWPAPASSSATAGPGRKGGAGWPWWPRERKTE